MKSGSQSLQMPRSLALGVLLTAMSVSVSLAEGGPDAYGYTWKDSNDVGGPSFVWVDITTVGTEVQGLGDDNAVDFVDVGFSFPYYWSSYGQIKVGSNGWLSFADTGNLAHCFPTMPTAGGQGDLILAPFMSDLIFDGAGNPAQVFYYHDQNTDRFIVSYLKVPFWTESAPGFLGSNTFQVILEADGSFTFQYGDVDSVNFNDQGGCSADLEIGFENQTGTIGIELFNDTVPPDNYAVTMVPPVTPLIDVPDATPTWTMNQKSQAIFIAVGTDLVPVVRIDNVGNAQIMSDIDVTVSIQARDSTFPYLETAVVAGGLVSNAGSTELFPAKNDLAAGHYVLESQTTNVEDINPGNNSRTNEIVVVDTSQPEVTLGYSTSEASTGSISWAGGIGGSAIEIAPPSYPARIDSVQMYILQPEPGPPTVGFQVQILDDDGGNGGPKSVLAAETMPALATGWQTATLNEPVTIYSGSFYVAFIQIGEGPALGTESDGPVSRRSWETLGVWAPYRANEDVDLMIKATVAPLAPPLFVDEFETGTIGSWSATNS